MGSRVPIEHLCCSNLCLSPTCAGRRPSASGRSWTASRSTSSVQVTMLQLAHRLGACCRVDCSSNPLCWCAAAGVDYVVRVQFPEPRSLKLAAAQGIWEALTGNWCAGSCYCCACVGLRSSAQQRAGHQRAAQHKPHVAAQC
jgi:hypothetical protein